jgi:hypothetical protein
MLCYVCVVCIEKMSLVRQLLVSTRCCTFLQCFVIGFEIKRPNCRFSNMKSFKAPKTCVANATLFPWRMFLELPWHFNVSLLIITYLYNFKEEI